MQSFDLWQWPVFRSHQCGHPFFYAAVHVFQPLKHGKHSLFHSSDGEDSFSQFVDLILHAVESVFTHNQCFLILSKIV
jgi:hypothetical protein